MAIITQALHYNIRMYKTPCKSLYWQAQCQWNKKMHRLYLLQKENNSNALFVDNQDIYNKSAQTKNTIKYKKTKPRL